MNWFASFSLVLFPLSVALTSCGSDSSSSTPAAAPTYAVAWSDIESTIETNCGGTGCHDDATAGAAVKQYVGNQTLFDNSLAANKTYIDSDLMPKPPQTWDDADNKTLVLQYIDERL